ncbi:MAG: lipoyl(octanoyl) transferase LipB [Zymomonas mobilis subsp. pomaceae]|uniref:Octanoyltransferase n=1 Tax=Zymomonas mobilis subsp. pomaceae (strain ATCC 29192 / DSM 22645 / JCM 10191 / CCUG 17912 / NBRC 13757 / NCIMB 11200 / NRRL B-4491 / Barker I) TaxID=579138 RepID=F8ET51_ZYMMT|nr:lipoyl(octanoyl) transferase LipB [Zymomonas mobilis]AEI36941.1 lipoate-protein ligase B [Zymomonas mobilis subsp. pomaceae ATCC 29192]MDX5948314.1 lipoyl(octanoyl) transferase LipB [Zymomonas mobilis subsp. pomaceae]GEB89069.1 octanoyltransferase [Zymomonas mobilis subsp. pomaceae]
MALDSLIEWQISPRLTEYEFAHQQMTARVEAILQGEAQELIWLLEHPPLYTAGRSADPKELLTPQRFPVYPIERGGRYTYHGPGQRIGYIMIDIKKHGQDVRRFVHGLEFWIITSLSLLGVTAYSVPERVGIWVNTEEGEAKIGAIGIRIKRGISFHGFSLNVAPDLEHFSGIVPCGLQDFGVTSLEHLHKNIEMTAVDEALKACFPHFLAFLEATSTP